MYKLGLVTMALLMLVLNVAAALPPRALKQAKIMRDAPEHVNRGEKSHPSKM
jgi:hypothetical protein